MGLNLGNIFGAAAQIGSSYQAGQRQGDQLAYLRKRQQDNDERQAEREALQDAFTRSTMELRTQEEGRKANQDRFNDSAKLATLKNSLGLIDPKQATARASQAQGAADTSLGQMGGGAGASDPANLFDYTASSNRADTLGPHGPRTTIVDPLTGKPTEYAVDPTQTAEARDIAQRGTEARALRESQNAQRAADVAAHEEAENSRAKERNDTMRAIASLGAQGRQATLAETIAARKALAGQAQAAALAKQREGITQKDQGGFGGFVRRNLGITPPATSTPPTPATAPLDADPIVAKYLAALKAKAATPQQP